MAGFIANSLSNYLWNGHAFMEAVNSTGGAKYPFSLDMTSFKDLYGSGRLSAELRAMNTALPTTPNPDPGTTDLRWYASAKNGTADMSGMPLFMGGTPLISYEGGFYDIWVSGNYLNLYNLVFKYPSECTTLAITECTRSGTSTSDDRGAIRVKLSASTAESKCNLSAYFEEANTATGTWTASGTFLDVTPSGVTASHTYVPWATYYSGYDYGTAESANAAYNRGGVIVNAIQPVNNLNLGYSTAVSGSSNSAMDLRLQQGFIIPYQNNTGRYIMSAQFTSQAGKSHAFSIRQPGTREGWYGTAGWVINRYMDGQTITNSSTPTGLTTGSGIIGSSYVVSNNAYKIPMRPFVSSQGTGAGTWTASGSGTYAYYARSGVKLSAV